MQTKCKARMRVSYKPTIREVLLLGGGAIIQLNSDNHLQSEKLRRPPLHSAGNLFLGNTLLGDSKYYSTKKANFNLVYKTFPLNSK